MHAWLVSGSPRCAINVVGELSEAQVRGVVALTLEAAALPVHASGLRRERVGRGRPRRRSERPHPPRVGSRAAMDDRTSGQERRPHDEAYGLRG
jgi:hypothetical protein